MEGDKIDTSVATQIITHKYAYFLTLYPKVPPDFDLSAPKQKRAAEVYAAALEDGKSSINAKMWPTEA